MSIFRQAVRSVARRALLPTTLGSAQIEAIDVGIRERAVFSARVTITQFLARVRSQIMALVAGEQPGPGQYTNPATVRLELRKVLDSVSYQPEPDQAGTIQDLRSDQRLNLIVRTQEQMATGYGQRVLSMDPDTIDLWPAWELVRVEDRVEKRDWVQRWRAAGGTVYPGSPGGLPLAPGFSEGRLIALKTDSIWSEISRFGSPHPPFDFNSGVGVEDVDRATTDELGITSPTQAVASAPADPSEYTDSTEASVEGLPDDFRATLEAEGYHVDGDVLSA